MYLQAGHWPQGWPWASALSSALALAPEPLHMCCMRNCPQSGCYKTTWGADATAKENRPFLPAEYSRKMRIGSSPSILHAIDASAGKYCKTMEGAHHTHGTAH